MVHVSIVIPFTKVDAYLAECLESLIHIHDENVDLVLVYDKVLSPSEKSCLEEYLQKLNIKCSLFFSPVTGLSNCLNAAINRAKGEYICRLDSDDLMIPNRIHLQRDYLGKNPDVAVIGGQILFIDEVGFEIPNRKSRYPVGKSKTRNSFEVGCYLAHPAVMMRKSCFLDVGGYRSRFKFAEDYDLWLRILDKYEIDNLSEVVTKYREHAGQSSQKMGKVNLYSMAAVMSRERRRSHSHQSDLPDCEIEDWVEAELDGLKKESESTGKSVGKNSKVHFLEIQFMNAKKLFNEGRIFKSSSIAIKILLVHPSFMMQKLYYFIRVRIVRDF